MKYVLAFDFGTQSIRGIIFDPCGQILWQKKLNAPAFRHPQKEWAEADPKEYRSALLRIVQSLRTEDPSLFSQVGALSLSSMRDCVTVVDKEGNALRPLILWIDQRKNKHLHPGSPLVLAAARLIGVHRLLVENTVSGYTNYIRDEEPEIWNTAEKFVFLTGYLYRWLLGRFVDVTACQPGHVPYDSKHNCWSGPLDIKKYVFPVEPEKLVDLVEPGTNMGSLSRQAQLELGFGPEVQVIAAASDKACETLGAGCLDHSQGVLSFGSQATIQTMSKHYYELVPFIPSFPAAIPGHWNPESFVFRGYWMVSWFLREIEAASVQMQEKPEESFDYYLSQTPSGNEGLVMYPYMGSSPKYPYSSGTFMGLRDYHRKAHLYRAMIEGINYTLREALETMERKGHTLISLLKVTGGGSSSDLICQITADIFNRETQRMKVTETTSLGASILAYKALGVFSDYEQAVKAMVHPDRIFTPNPETVALYEKVYRTYRKHLKTRIHFKTEL